MLLLVLALLLKMKKHIIIAAILIFFYIIIMNSFNFLASYSFPAQNQIIQGQIGGSSAMEIAQVSTSLSLSVSRKRWYGEIYEIIDGQGKISNLYLLGFIKLPLRNIDINYALYHILFFISILTYTGIAAAIKLINYKKYKYYHI